MNEAKFQAKLREYAKLIRKNRRKCTERTACPPPGRRRSGSAYPDGDRGVLSGGRKLCGSDLGMR